MLVTCVVTTDVVWRSNNGHSTEAGVPSPSQPLVLVPEARTGRGHVLFSFWRSPPGPVKHDPSAIIRIITGLCEVYLFIDLILYHSFLFISCFSLVVVFTTPVGEVRSNVAVLKN